jgi:trimeric autotransporter adhesin
MQFSTGMGRRGGALTNGFKGKLLRDWTLMTNITVASGAPLTPMILNRALGGTGITGPLRAFYTGLPVYNPDGSLNPAAFITPPAGVYGNAGRNIIVGPNLFSLNASASRTIRLGERRSADFRVDARNALNHVSFGSFNTTVGSTQFGLLQSPGAMRSLTATLRLRF